MKHRVLITLVTLLLPTLSMAQQQCNEVLQQSTPVSQFTVNANGTVLDQKTQLIWKLCAEGQVWDSVNKVCNGETVQYSWADALQAVQTKNTSGGYAGFTDWRMPNVKELLSIVEFSCYEPAINVSVFPNAVSDTFWSSTPNAENPEYVYILSYYYGWTWASKKEKNIVEVAPYNGVFPQGSLRMVRNN